MAISTGISYVFSLNVYRIPVEELDVSLLRIPTVKSNVMVLEGVLGEVIRSRG